MIFDTHAHYDDSAFDEDRESLIKRLPSFNVGSFVNVGASLRGSEESVKLSQQFENVYAAAGIHPDECSSMDETVLARIKELALLPRTLAIGEIGLDYHGFEIYDNKPSKEIQKKWFIRQLELAKELDMPVIVHSRNACEDTLSVMKTSGIKDAVIHCFSYSVETAREYVDMGYYLGFGGSTTYEGQKKISKVLKAVPYDRILLETDCPYLSPVPKRGERNFSGNLKYVVNKIAEIKGIGEADLEDITWQNACRFYRIKEKK